MNQKNINPVEVAKRTIALEAGAVEGLAALLLKILQNMRHYSGGKRTADCKWDRQKCSHRPKKLLPPSIQPELPAFLHAADAIHGDLGMIRNEDGDDYQQKR